MTFDCLCPSVLLNNPITAKKALNAVRFSSENLALTPLYRKYWSESKQGGSLGKIHSTKKLHPGKPSPTIIKAEGNGGLYHFSEPRLLSLYEFQRLAFFPDLYLFTKLRKDWKERIGNSVPPGLMRAVALNVRHYLFDGEPLTPYPKTITYLEILDATWQDHLKPKDENAPTVISTFAGGGGSSLGYSMAGYKELLAVEIDNNAVETLRLNFPDLPIYHGDIGKLSVEECMELAGLTEPGQLDVLDGSPPCQGFSTAGKRKMSDNRNQLFREYVRLLKGLQPKVFIMENVSGMVKGKMKIIFAEILRELKASGYEVKAWLLNAKYFYVPQSRERMIFIGVRQDFWQELSQRGDDGAVL